MERHLALAEGGLASSVDDLTEDAFSVCDVQLSSSVHVNVFPSWGTESIYFDFSSAEMRSQQDVDALSGFVRTLGRIVEGPVTLSHEGDWADVYAVYDPERDEFCWSD